MFRNLASAAVPRRHYIAVQTTLVLVVLVALVTLAWPQQSQRVFTLQISEADLGVIGRGLEGLPYRDSAPVIARLQQQVAPILKQPEAQTGAGADKQQFGQPEKPIRPPEE